MTDSEPEPALTDRLLSILGEMPLGLDADGSRRWLERELTETGTTGYLGFVVFAGRVNNGEFAVQFNADVDGWSSRWPQWAYELARDALLHGRKVIVISNGLPWGTNLLHVHIRYDEA